MLVYAIKRLIGLIYNYNYSHESVWIDVTVRDIVHQVISQYSSEVRKKLFEELHFWLK